MLKGDVTLSGVCRVIESRRSYMPPHPRLEIGKTRPIELFVEEIQVTTQRLLDALQI